MIVSEAGNWGGGWAYKVVDVAYEDMYAPGWMKERKAD